MNDLSVKELDLLQRIDEKEDLRPIFFQKVKGLKWFDALSERGYFKPENNPKPEPAKEKGFINIPFWQVTNYIVKTAPELSVKDNQESAKKFLQILFNVTKYSKEQGFSNYRTWFQFAEIIPHIPSENISLEHIDMIDYWLNDQYDDGLIAREVGEKWLPSLLENDDQHSLELAKVVLSILYKIIFQESLSGELFDHKAAFRFSCFHAREINKKLEKLVGKKLGKDAVQVLDLELNRILREQKYDSLSYLWQPAVEPHDQNKHRDDAENILVEAYRDSLTGFARSNPEEAFKYVTEMLGSEYQIIHRLAIYAISTNYVIFSNLVDSVLNDKFLGIGYQHEMWHFIQENYQEFTESQKLKTLALISGIKINDDKGKIHEVATAYRKASWFASIKDHGDKEAHEYHVNVEIARSEPEHPDFSSYISSVRGGPESPVSLEELAALSFEELINTLNKYEDAGSYFEPGLESLAKEFRQLIKADPLRYYLSLPKFSELDHAYIHALIEAYGDLRTEKANLPWDSIWHELLNFCSIVISQDRFWAPEKAEERDAFVANRHWIVSSIGRLVEEGTKSDDNAIPEDNLRRAEEIVGCLLEKKEGSEFKLDSEAVNVAINSPRGRCIEALINLTLRSCRLADKKNDKDHSLAWSHFQPYYDSEFDRADREKPEYEFATLVARYLPHFLYMSKDWVLANLGRIFDKNHHNKWLCAMQGYAYVGNVYEQIYDFLKEHGDFLKVLDDDNIQERVEERVIQNISIAYMYDFEDLSKDDSLIKILLQRGKYEELSHLIWSIRNLPVNDNENLKYKVYALWARLLNVLELDSKEGKKLASKLCHWATFVDRVNEKTQGLLYPIVPYADEEHNSYILLESIASISNAQPFEAFTLWIKLLKHSRADYPEEAIRQIFSNLVKDGPDGIRAAREIQDEYIKRGNERPSIWLEGIIKEQENI